MLKQLIFTGLVVGQTLLLAGCRSEMPAHLNEDFGNAVRANVALQTLNPDAGGPDASDSLDGPRAAQAVQRMRERSNQADSGSLIQDVGN